MARDAAVYRSQHRGPCGRCGNPAFVNGLGAVAVADRDLWRTDGASCARWRQVGSAPAHASEPVPRDSGTTDGLQYDRSQRLKLRKLLKGARFARQVADGSQCTFVRFTGVLFERCEVSEEHSRGLLPEHEKYENDVNFAVVDIPAEFLTQCEIVPPRHRVCAVYERFGVPLDTLHIQQEIMDSSIAAEDSDYARWADAGEAWRTETNTNHPDYRELYREDFYAVDYE